MQSPKTPEEWHHFNIQRALMIGEGNDSHDYHELEEIFRFSDPPPDHETIITIAACIYFALALGGFIANVFFCIIIWRSEKLHTVTHVLMSNLAVCNIIFLLFHPPYFMSTFILETNWNFGTVLCKTSFAIPYVTVTGSFYFMSLVAVDRWLAIFRRKCRLNKRTCVWLSVAAWAISFGVALPYMFNGEVFEDHAMFSEFLTTRTRSCGGTVMPKYMLYVTIATQYCIPLAVMIPAYAHLCFFLWKRPTIGYQSKEKTKKAHARRSRLIATLIGIVVLLILSWVPLFAITLINRIHHVGAMAYIIVSCLTLLGVLLTPICYLTNDGFRQQISTIFPCLAKRQRSPAEQNLLEMDNTAFVSSPRLLPQQQDATSVNARVVLLQVRNEAEEPSNTTLNKSN